jgi:hypothetical protein
MGVNAAGAANGPTACAQSDLQRIQIMPPGGGGSLTGLFRPNMSKCSDDPDATGQPPDCIVRVRGFARISCPGGTATCARASSIGIGCTVDPLPANSTVPGGTMLAQSLCNQQNIYMIAPQELMDPDDQFGGGMPVCTTGQNLEFVDGRWVCSAPHPRPTCGPGELLTVKNGDQWGCVPAVPTCTAGQLLTFNGSAWACVTPAPAGAKACTASLCTNSGQYCAGVAYYNLANNCTCAGTGPCGPNPNPSPDPFCDIFANDPNKMPNECKCKDGYEKGLDLT